jgi:hypothetical protein
MQTFAQRVVGAARLEPRTYEEVEEDRGANLQAVAVVLLASIAGGIGLRGMGVMGPRSMITDAVGALVGWIAWAALTYVIGTRLLPGAQTRADIGQLLRTIGFAAAPGVLRVLGTIPVLGPILYAVASVWMLLAMVVAVRQALDYTSTIRALAVCAVGWALSLILAAIIGNVFATVVS